MGLAKVAVRARIAQEMYDETGLDGKRPLPLAQIAAGFGVTRPAIYRATLQGSR